MSIGPEDRTTQINNWCTYGPLPLVMTGILRLWLIDYFSRMDNITAPTLQSRIFKYTPDTGLAIEDALTWKPELTEKRPAIIIRREEWVPQRVGALEHKTGTTEEGFWNYVRIWTGAHTLFCLCKEGAEAELLAGETYKFLLHYIPVFRTYFNLLRFDIGPIGRPAEVEESRDHWGVPINVNYGWSESWDVLIAQPKMTRVTISELFGLGL